MTKSQEQADGTGLIALDPWLEPYRDALRSRYEHYLRTKANLIGGDLAGEASLGHLYFGLNRGERDGKTGVWYREWAPGAHGLFLCGEFNEWDRSANPLTRDEWGVWVTFLPDEDYAIRLVHGGRVKVHVQSEMGAMDRIPAYIRRIIRDGDASYAGQYWNPPKEFKWKHQNPMRSGGLRVYEAHVGMALEDGRVGTFTEFTTNVLPRIADLGYNAVQLMAIMEHPYYGSFGYQVSNLFAVSSRFGTPEELKQLVDTAHGLGLAVIMDLVHSHMVKNVDEGLNRFDGTDFQYFHSGARGLHPAWDSMTYDYAKPEVLRLLLSNVRFWLEEFHLDGFRFDGVTSMLFHDHGLGRAFSSYDDYFSDNVDWDALAYLMLANELAHEVKPAAITIAEDVSGMVGMARPVSEGGLGFDYRLAMGVPDLWIKILKERKDEEWPLGDIFQALLNRRRSEKHIGYAESHDQAMVGDKTIAFWLMDARMYSNMSKFNHDLVIDRGLALHKMIRLLTFSLAGEGYLNFMGNEFGHPEWIDFPRAENNYSHHYARRQWSLVDQPHLHYHELRDFDKAMMALDEQYALLQDELIEQLALHEDTRQLIYRRGRLVFAFNFHPTESFPNLRIPIPDARDYYVILNTDSPEFGGQGLIPAGQNYPWQPVPMYGKDQSIQIYIPARSAQVLST
ncbi:MAG TPA: alpha-amylase family glycosyl hydrolase [Fimbriimonas sp.]|nr:alpha-amylase family glycosyl hydrolase [Fimbriimonas sp.]